MNGPTFLILYLILLAAALIVSIVGVRAARPQGRMQDQPPPETLAWLAGGRSRLNDALTAGRLAARELCMNGGKRFMTPDGAALRWRDVTGSYAARADAVEKSLKQQGLLVADDELPTLRRWALWPFLLLAAIGVARLIHGVAGGYPVGFLVILLIVTIVLGLIRLGSVSHLTTGGRETLARARTAHDRLRRAPTQPEMGTAVALFGTTVLAGSAFGNFHQFRSPSGGDGGSAGDGGSSDGGSSDGGGGGCGGGGCGGCSS